MNSVHGLYLAHDSIGSTPITMAFGAIVASFVYGYSQLLSDPVTISVRRCSGTFLRIVRVNALAGMAELLLVPEPW